MRVDRLLFFLRLAKSRSLAQKMIEAGGIRIDGVRASKCSQLAAVGQVLTLVAQGQLRVIQLLAIPERRGPPSEAATMIIDKQPPLAIDGARAGI